MPAVSPRPLNIRMAVLEASVSPSLSVNSGFSGTINRLGAGEYEVFFNTTFPDTNYIVHVTPNSWATTPDVLAVANRFNNRVYVVIRRGGVSVDERLSITVIRP